MRRGNEKGDGEGGYKSLHALAVNKRQPDKHTIGPSLTVTRQSRHLSRGVRITDPSYNIDSRLTILITTIIITIKNRIIREITTDNKEIMKIMTNKNPRKKF